MIDKCEGGTEIGKTADKVGSTVNWIDNPLSCLLNFLGFFPKESIVRKVRPQKLNDGSLNGSICVAHVVLGSLEIYCQFVSSVKKFECLQATNMNSFFRDIGRIH